MDKPLLIQSIRAVMPVSPETANIIADQFEERFIEKNAFFLQEGKRSNEYLYLEQGFMRAFTYDLNGDEVTTYFYPENRAVFEVASFFMRTISNENIQAITDCRGYVITYDNLNRLFHTYPEFREFGRSMLVKEFSLFKQRTLSLICQTAEERYLQLMNTNDEIFRHAQLKHIASYLGITDTSLSRIRREYSKKDGRNNLSGSI